MDGKGTRCKGKNKMGREKRASERTREREEEGGGRDSQSCEIKDDRGLLGEGELERSSHEEEKGEERHRGEKGKAKEMKRRKKGETRALPSVHGSS